MVKKSTVLPLKNTVGLLIKCLLALVVIITMATCAKQGSPSGGPIDSLPPVFVKSDPPNYTTNFEEQHIRIYFDEYVKLDNYQKQLIISPPLKYTTVSPQGTAAKYVSIEIRDTLEANTTYVFNFGQSIVDNNESNPYSYFKYIFSTGDYIDSLTVKGSIKDAILRETESFISVMLYAVDSAYTDSTAYKEAPRYVTNTLDSLTDFELTNLKEGTYALVGIKDENSDFKYQPSSDKIAFLDEYITVPKDTTYALTIFKEVPELKVGRPRQAAAQRINFGYTGDGDSLKINLLSSIPSPIETVITKKENIDTLQYWFKPEIEADSLNFELSTATFKDTVTTRLRTLQADSLSFTSTTGAVLVLGDTFTVSSSIPITTINEELIQVLDKDSMAVNFSSVLNPKESNVKLDFETKEDNQYQIQILPEALSDFLGNSNDTLSYRVRTREFLNYSDIELTLVNAKAYPYIVQLLDDRDNLVQERFATRETVFTFNTLKPGKYYLRLIEDTNGNGVFDTGNYLEKRQPERVIYYNELIDAPEGWFPKKTFTLKDRGTTTLSSPVEQDNP